MTAAASSVKVRSPAAARHAFEHRTLERLRRLGRPQAVPIDLFERPTGLVGAADRLRDRQTGDRAPYSVATATTFVKSDGDANGRAASWIAMTSLPCSASSPAQLDAVRLAPPGTTLAGEPTSQVMAGTRSAGATTTVAPKMPDASAAASDHSRAACPPKVPDAHLVGAGAARAASGSESAGPRSRRDQC